MTAYTLGTLAGMVAWCIPGIAPLHVGVAVAVALGVRRVRANDTDVYRPRSRNALA